jgi:hypothetical protein
MSPLVRTRQRDTSRGFIAGLACIVGLTVVTTAAQASPGGLVAGPTLRLGDGSGYAWVRRDGSGKPIAFGLSIDDAALTKLGDEHTKTAFPLPTVDGLPFRTIVVDWEPKGHRPTEVYGVPHFDFHAYAIGESAREAITADGPSGPVMPSPDLVPDGYVAPMPSTVPKMGMHFVPAGAPEFHGGTFAATPVYGYSGGHFAFIESMITLSYLKNLPTASGTIALPLRVETTGTYPQRWTVAHDGQIGRYEIGFEGLAMRESAESITRP